jgi:hypothetical protein
VRQHTECETAQGNTENVMQTAPAAAQNASANTDLRSVLAYLIGTGQGTTMKINLRNSRVLPWLAALLLSALAAGCGGGREPILGIGGGTATLVPTVTAVTPLPNTTTVPVNTQLITATFSKDMDPATLTTASFALECPVGTPVAGAVSYLASSRTATLTLPAAVALAPNTQCTATVSSAARDSAGIALAANFVWTFRTAGILDTTPPQVTATVNANGAIGVAVNTKVGATFSEAMDPTTITAASFTFKQGANVIAGATSYSGLTATFTPTNVLAFNTTYTATLTTAAKDLAGNGLASDYVWSWTTGAAADTTAPTVTATVNADGATGVALNTKVGATFSEAMDPLTISTATFLFKQGATVVAGTTGYSGLNAVFTPLSPLTANTTYTATLTTGAKDLAGNALAPAYVWSWTTGAAVDVNAPTVVLVNPADLATNVALNARVNATFSEAMDPLSISTASLLLKQGANAVTGTTSYSGLIAVFTPGSALTANTTYTATVTTLAKDLAGNALAANKVWSFTTAAAVVVPPAGVNLGSAATFGTFGGSAGMTNTGTLTQVNGAIGSIATGTASVTGFHDTAGDIYTETPANVGAVNGKIYTCTNSVTGPTSTGSNAASCAIATQARLDAQSAYLALAAMPAGANPGANLAGLTLTPGVYTSPSGSFLVEGGNLTLDAQGNANAVFVFQMATTLTVGGPGAAAPQSIILSGGAQAKNVFWQVGSFATINAGGSGTMVGTIISQAGASFSTAGNVAIVTLNGRVLSLGASVTLVDTVINVPGN